MTALPAGATTDAPAGGPTQRAAGIRPAPAPGPGPDPANAHVSSSLVRQVAALGGDISPYVPRVVAEYLQKAPV